MEPIEKLDYTPPPVFPVRQIVDVLVAESKSRFDTIRRELPYIGNDDEIRELESEHMAAIRELDSYQAIDEWLWKYRRINLEDWVDSLPK